MPAPVPHSCTFPLPTHAALQSAGAKNIDPHLYSDLLNAIDALVDSPELKAIAAEQEAERHCVRCHGTFTDESNESEGCIIPHVFGTESEFTGEVDGYDKIYAYMSTCCGSDVQLEEEGAGNDAYRNVDDFGYCYIGYHTADVEEVEEDEGYNGANVCRCKIDEETGACISERIDDDEFLWDWQVSK